MALTKQELEQWLSYEPETGVFRWIRDAGSIKAGSVAGGKSDHGYRRLCLQKKFYAEHRLAWLAVHGVWPSHEIDHINGVRDDNRIVNLRDVPRVVNLQNIRTRKDNSVGLAGVRRDKVSGNFRAQIRHNGTTIQLGSFTTAEGAHAAYVEAKRKMHIGFVPEPEPDTEADSWVLPEPVSDVWTTFRGERCLTPAGDDYYTSVQVRAAYEAGLAAPPETPVNTTD